MSGGNEVSRAIKDGYLKATRTVICQSCSKIRSTENIYQIKPRIKCLHCHEKSEAFKKARKSNAL